MTTTVLIAKLLGPLAILFGISFLVNQKFYTDSLTKKGISSSVAYISGIFTLLFGLLIIAYHNIWELNINGFITLLGWLLLIHGAINILNPKRKLKVIYELKGRAAVVITGLLALIIGGYLSWFSYFTF